MALTPEDGTGLENADSLVSLASADAFLAALGFAEWAAAAEPDREAALRRGSAWLSLYYRWKGIRTHGRAQALSWPRTGATDAEGLALEPDEMPVELLQAASLAGLAELRRPGSLTPTITPLQQVKRRRIGPIDITFRDHAQRVANDLSGIDDSRPVVAAVYDRVRGLIQKPLHVGITVA